MKDKEMGSTLRELRERENLTIKDVISELDKHGISISDKALYSYESGKRAASADMFLALCEIYKCNNILEIFSNVKVDYSVPTDTEWVIIEKYRSLDPVGKELVDHTLKVESGRSETLRNLYEQAEKIRSLDERDLKIMKLTEDNKSHLIPNAAHERTDIEVTEEMKKYDDAFFDE